MLHIYHFLYFFHSPFFFYRQYMGYHQTIHRWKYILKMADHRFLLQHFSPSQSPAAPLCNDQTSCICKTKGLWWKKNSCQFYSRAEGCKVWDLDGKEYIDLLCGYGPNILGYGDQVTNIKVTSKSKWVDAPTMKDKSSTKKNTCHCGYHRH